MNNKQTFNAFPQGEELDRMLYELARKEGDKHFGSECKHETVKNGRCTNCLRKVR